LKSKIDVNMDLLPRLPIINPEIGSLVHIEVSKKLCRGIILAVKDSKCKVQLVDHGRVVVTIRMVFENVEMIFKIADFGP
jgi:hypothetical protein